MEVLINTTTTGRYFIKGEISSKIQIVWFVFHGYGMSAESFIEEFTVVSDEVTLIIAPEGFHRFYNRGTRGEIGANWMTSDLRENDIANNIEFLNNVLKDVFSSGLNKGIRIGVVGFSQGGPTSFRWVSQLNHEVSQLIAWGTDIPEDIVTNHKCLKKINDSGIKLVIGTKDEYISSDQVDDLIIDLHDKGVDFDYHTFDGGHRIDESKMRYFHARIIDESMEY